MEAIRKKNVKRNGRQVIIDLPEDFKAKEVDLIIWPSESDVENQNPSDKEVEIWREKLKKSYANLSIDLSGYKFNRDELYDR